MIVLYELIQSYNFVDTADIKSNDEQSYIETVVKSYLISNHSNFFP